MWSYSRDVNYYETDRMGVIHHSNYLRILEEARMAWMEANLIPYPEIERQGNTFYAVVCADYKDPCFSRSDSLILLSSCYLALLPSCPLAILPSCPLALLPSCHLFNKKYKNSLTFFLLTAIIIEPLICKADPCSVFLQGQSP